ncbi:MAG: ankyrin repeat domain-containing protein [Rickettsiaceae bacterium]|nr:ankyrin repeat domain-containing protein [Rickettsiaceae bacterium]
MEDEINEQEIDVLDKLVARLIDAELIFAIKTEDIGAAKILIQAGADVNHKNGNNTPLNIAIRKNNHGLVKLLLSNHANVNCRAADNITPLHLACKWGCNAIATTLVENGAEINARTLAYQYAPLHIASAYGYEDIVSMLIKNNANINALANNMQISVLYLASANNHCGTVSTLIAKGTGLNGSCQIKSKALQIACENGNTEVAKILIENGADMYIRHHIAKGNALHIAVSNNHIDLAIMLIKYGLSAKTLLDKNTVLHIACKKGYAKMAKALLKHISPNLSDKYGDKPIHAACEYGHIEVVDLLIKNGVSVNQENSFKQSPLHIAVKNGNFEMVKSLLKNDKVDVHHLDFLKKTPLHYATEDNSLEIAKILMEYETKINSQELANKSLLDLLDKADITEEPAEGEAQEISTPMISNNTTGDAPNLDPLNPNIEDLDLLYTQEKIYNCPFSNLPQDLTIFVGLSADEYALDRSVPKNKRNLESWEEENTPKISKIDYQPIDLFWEFGNYDQN